MTTRTGCTADEPSHRTISTRHRHPGLLAAIATAGVLVAAACTPPPAPPAPPGPPVIQSFSSVSTRTAAPVVAALRWHIGDPNHDALTCRLDADGDGAVDRVIAPCKSGSALAQFDMAGTRSPTLEVSDGSFAPVTAATTVTVDPGPAETYDIALRLDPAMRPEFQQAFEDAAARWEEVIAAGVPDVPLDLPGGLFGWVPAFSGVVDDVLIDARDTPIDGPGNVLGSAGGLLVRQPQWQPYYGVMQFDTDDLEALDASGRLDDVILHEMGHVLGLGTSWLPRGVIADPLVDPAYSDPAAVAAYQELGGVGNVPVEDEGQAGTAFSHWRESAFGDELMTGYLGSRPTVLSRVTIGALADQGYGVDLGAAEPYSLPAPSAALRAAPGDGLHTDPIPPFMDGLPNPLPGHL